MSDTLGPFEIGRVHHAFETLAALSELPDDSVDALITDPPYSSGGFTRSDRAADPAAKYERSDVALPRISFSGDNRDGRSWAWWCSLWLSECLRVVKPGGYAMMFCDWRQTGLAQDSFQSGGFVWRGLVSWDKGESARAPNTAYFRHQAEYVVWGSKGPLAPCEHGGPFPGVLRFPVVQSDKHHMTGKPTELMRALVKPVVPGGIVLDPFAGSGTTLVACALEGRRGLGFEREEENVRISNERIEAVRNGIDAKAALANQRAMFDGPRS